MNDQRRAEAIEERIDKDVTGGMQIAGGGQAMTIQPQNMNEVFELAKMMSTAGPMIRKPFRLNPGACLAVVNQALRWGMDPYAVINKAYLVGDGIGYEAQLVHAVVNARAPLQRRLRPSYEGEGADLVCTVKGLLVGEDEEHIYISPRVADIDVKNSPLWTSDPEQQLWYYSVRAWARRHVPEVLLGVYTEDELRAPPRRGPTDARDVTPARPTRGSVKEELQSEPADGDAAEGDDAAPDEQILFPLFNNVGEELGQYDDLDWMKTFRAWLETGKMEADFVRNNYEVGALIVAGTIDGMALRDFQLIIAEWFEPHEWQNQPEDEGDGHPSVLDPGHEEQGSEGAKPDPKAKQPDDEGPAEPDASREEQEDEKRRDDEEADAIPSGATMGSREDDDIQMNREDDFPGDRKEALAPDTEQAAPAGNEATGDPESESVADAGAAWPTFSKDGEFLGHQSTPGKFLDGLQDIVEGEAGGREDRTGMDSWRSNAEGRRQIMDTKNGALTARLGLIEKIAYGK